MELSSRILRQIILLSLVVLIVPMLIFPERLGMDLVKASFVNAIFELIFYAFIIFMFHRRTKLIQLLQAAGICLIYRLSLGLIFGFLIVVMYPMKLSIALSLGMSSYLPAILFHIFATPLILKPVIDDQLAGNVSRVTVPPPKTVNETQGVTIAVSKEKGVSISKKPIQPVEEKKIIKEPQSVSSSLIPGGEGNGFENAVRYIGGDGSVKLAAIVDYEGLLLASFKRGDIEPEDVTPFTLSLLKNNNLELSQFGYNEPQKIEFTFEDMKIVIAGERIYSLLVISERTANDILNIRINQGLEMIRKYIAERYSSKLIGKAESIYV